MPGLPTAPTDVLATPGNGEATVTFLAAADNGSTITQYTVTATDGTNAANGGETAVGTASPILITGLTNGDLYSFTVSATNAIGSGASSYPSGPIMPSSEPALMATGSSFAAVAIQEWVGQLATLDDLNINWQVSSSVIGLNTFAQDQVDFAASDIPYSSMQSTYLPEFPYQYVPDLASGLSLMYNLIGNDGQQITSLILNARVSEEIFLGEITNWNDPAIAALNPQLAGDLPNTKIVPVYRTDASGENYLVSDYFLYEDAVDGGDFAATQTTFEAGPAGSPTAVWPTPAPGITVSAQYPGWQADNLVGQNGSDNAANYVASPDSDGAITYVETAYAKEHDFPVASLLNAGGNAVQPTSTSVTAALKDAGLNPDLTQNLAKVYSDRSPTAYPLSSYSYLITPCSPTLASAQGTECDGTGTSTFPTDKGFVLGTFINYLACAGQEQMSELGYAPLPKNLVRDDFKAVGRIEGATEPPRPTAANCPNPTITGG
jgi:phosphate transport system substrate-binding protein